MIGAREAKARIVPGLGKRAEGRNLRFVSDGFPEGFKPGDSVHASPQEQE